MRKIILFLFLFFGFFGANFISYGLSNPYPGAEVVLKEIPDNFNIECYEYYNKIDKSDIGYTSTDNRSETYKINIPENRDLIISQNGYLLAYKFYTSKNELYGYTNNLGIENSSLSDFNKKTYIEIIPKEQNELILTFDEGLKENQFTFNFEKDSSSISDYLIPYGYYSSFYISNDNINWEKIKQNDLENFSFKYLKITFDAFGEEYLKKIKIYELSFVKKTNSILVNSYFDNDIEFYYNYNCKEKDFSDKANAYDSFSIDTETTTIDLELQKNPKYNVYSKKDYDNDGLENEIDNCKYHYNTDQKDSNGDGVGDICSDVDGDGIKGYDDNCPYISNRDQIDLNNNSIGDACEFDKDEDGIYDSIDNCITIQNPKQTDTDKDGIGDSCDNCGLYNPDQLDVNANGIGDFCEDEQEYKEKNDDDNDGILNYLDNCKDISNPKQTDTDKDGIGDVCDNCKEIQNPKQEDLDENGKGDFCEDIDLDGVIGYQDNCIYLANRDQLDDNNDGIGNVCEDKDGDNIWFINDNCPYKYNPDQVDIDNDEIGDKCDENDDRYIESNKTFFIGLLILITIVFGGAIFYTIKKIK